MNKFIFCLAISLSTFAFSQDAPVKKAIAHIKPASGSNVKGVVRFENVNGGTEIVAEIEGLTPGKHGFHIHEKGDCSAWDASSVGDHYNPRNDKHGGPDMVNRHVGDLGNIKADENGKASYTRVDSMVELNGEESIIGRAIVVHSGPDDYVSQPSGNAGTKIGCGVIEAVSE